MSEGLFGLQVNEEVKRQLTQALTLRGQARKAEAERLMGLGERSFLAFMELLGAQSASQRDLATQMIGRFKPSTEHGWAMFGAVVRGLLESGKPTWNRLGFQAVAAKGVAFASCGEALSEVLTEALRARTYDELAAVAAMAAVGAMGWGPAQVVEALDGLLDHWSAQVRGEATRQLLKHHGKGRPPRWHDYGLSLDVIRQAQRLGATFLDRPAEPDLNSLDGSWWVEKSNMSWSVTDPRGEYKQFPLPAWCFLNCIRFPIGRSYRIRRFGDELYGLDFVGSSENFDLTINGKRHLFYHFAYTDTQFYYSLDLTDSSADPSVGHVDHDGSDPSIHGTLSEVLKLVV
jgi:hypothetical protein